MSLQLNWNLVALPVQPVSGGPATVLASMTGKYRRVYTYQACDSANLWKLYDPGGPSAGQRPDGHRAGDGLWIKATTALPSRSRAGRSP